MQLLDATERNDKVAPFSEAFLRGVREPALGHVHDVREEGGKLVGIAALAPDGSAEIAVHPNTRRRGHGRALAEAVLARVPKAQLWAHGNLPAAQALAESLGLASTRELLVMGIEGTTLDAAANPAIPSGFEALNYPQAVERFGTQNTERAWLTANNEAFSWHPEQGGWDVARLHQGMDTDWFDPSGVWFLYDGDQLAGFHWTKRHPGDVGEVYVIGLATAYRGKGLGAPLLSLGLKHLVDAASCQVILYVEADNAPAVRRYTEMGFRVREQHVVYAR